MPNEFDVENSFDIIQFGEGDPEVTVVGGVHGDELCGVKAIDSFCKEVDEQSLERPVQLIIANKDAVRKGERYIDLDLNRAFANVTDVPPSEVDHTELEQRLALGLHDVIKGTTVLDLHSTVSYPNPFVVVQDKTSEITELCLGVGIPRVIHLPPEHAGSGLISSTAGIAVECGYRGTRFAAETATEIIYRFLDTTGVLQYEYESQTPHLYPVYDSVNNNDYEFVRLNFERVREDEIYAELNTKRNNNSADEDKNNRKSVLRASEDFIPVLMGGYDEILGFKSKSPHPIG